jgi:hypothetical protein
MADKVPHNALVVVADGAGRGSSATLVTEAKSSCHPKASLSPIL